MSWLWSALMPHPPVLLSEIGRGKEKEAAKTLQGIEKITKAITKPDLLFVLSPHQPYSSGALFINSADVYHGSFAPFGASYMRLTMLSADSFEFILYLELSGIPVLCKAFEDLTRDQGSMVPLYLLKRAWGDLPPVIIASPIGLTPQQAFKMGQSLAEFPSNKNFALLASGDLSHCLTPDAPVGHEPEYAPIFEVAVEEALKTSSPDPLFGLDEIIIERAGECGLRSLMVMLGLVSCIPSSKIKILSHEWPFGVSYCNALWMNYENAPVKLARETVRRLLEGRYLPENGNEVIASPLWKEKRACFVSIKEKNGSLRGCIGTLRPLYASLDKEIISNAVSASARDPRFSPMKKNELYSVIFSVDVLSKPEAVNGIEQLDPKRYGVIVSRGYRSGVLLPDLEGVNTSEQQVQIAAMKAGLCDIDGIKLERFTVERYKEI